jgi:hypothetical protein
MATLDQGFVLLARLEHGEGSADGMDNDGALFVVSHDPAFIEAIGCDREIGLNGCGVLDRSHGP